MTVIDERKSESVTFEGTNPIFRVQSVQASIEHYVNVLGFKLNWDASGFASVGRGRCGIMLCEGDQGHFGTWVWIGVSDVDQVFAEYKAKGAKIRHGPTNFEWAQEIQVEDLDGNVLRLGSDSKTDQPFGPWLDMNGVLWKKTPEGWSRVEKH